jgi:hypothetical protein
VAADAGGCEFFNCFKARSLTRSKRRILGAFAFGVNGPFHWIGVNRCVTPDLGNHETNLNGIVKADAGNTWDYPRDALA